MDYFETNPFKREAAADRLFVEMGKHYSVELLTTLSAIMMFRRELDTEVPRDRYERACMLETWAQVLDHLTPIQVMAHFNSCLAAFERTRRVSAMDIIASYNVARQASDQLLGKLLPEAEEGGWY